MKKYCSDLVVNSVERISNRFVLIKLTQGTPLPPIMPGQFVEVRVDGSPRAFLRRPISVHYVDRELNELWLLVAVVGEGTQWMSQLHFGDVLNAVYPLGNGFSLSVAPGQRCLLVGGGVGIAPLLELGKELSALGADVTFLLGGKNASDVSYVDIYKKYGRVLLTTEDGSVGEQGFVTQHSVLSKERFDSISVCGPKPMMVAVARYAKEHGIPCEVSLENLMACGLGACLCCVEKTVEGNLCVCKEGPVFNINRLLWLS